uniref:Uncharacterized protein n=1 Tax=Vitis vinifera TaxID=29760 RepID=A5B059_VITVI|nr:hypothetical protein VITISV_011220 [Vitis vinifera]
MHCRSRACQQFLGFGWPPFGIADLHEATVVGMSRFLTIGADRRARRANSFRSLLRGGFVIGRSRKESHGIDFGSGDTHQALGLLLVYDRVVIGQRWQEVDVKDL